MPNKLDADLYIDNRKTPESYWTSGVFAVVFTVLGLWYPWPVAILPITAGMWFWVEHGRCLQLQVQQQ
jgi:hypothetical protein